MTELKLNDYLTGLLSKIEAMQKREEVVVKALEEIIKENERHFSLEHKILQIVKIAEAAFKSIKE